MVFRRTFNPPLTSFVSLSFFYSLLLNVQIKRSLTEVGKFSLPWIFGGQTASGLRRYDCSAHIICIRFALVAPSYQLF
jgi:hypothetical protein